MIQLRCAVHDQTEAENIRGSYRPVPVKRRDNKQSGTSEYFEQQYGSRCLGGENRRVGPRPWFRNPSAPNTKHTRTKARGKDPGHSASPNPVVTAATPTLYSSTFPPPNTVATTVTPTLYSSTFPPPNPVATAATPTLHSTTPPPPNPVATAATPTLYSSTFPLPNPVATAATPTLYSSTFPPPNPVATAATPTLYSSTFPPPNPVATAATPTLYSSTFPPPNPVATAATPTLYSSTFPPPNPVATAATPTPYSSTFPPPNPVATAATPTLHSTTPPPLNPATTAATTALHSTTPTPLNPVGTAATPTLHSTTPMPPNSVATAATPTLHSTTPLPPNPVATAATPTLHSTTPLPPNPVADAATPTLHKTPPNPLVRVNCSSLEQVWLRVVFKTLIGVCSPSIRYFPLHRRDQWVAAIQSWRAWLPSPRRLLVVRPGAKAAVQSVAQAGYCSAHLRVYFCSVKFSTDSVFGHTVSIVMPGSIFCGMDRGIGFEDQRALQLALELSMLGANGFSDGGATPAAPVPEAESPVLPTAFIVPEEGRNKKSQNMTECVPVPSSEHVAEIVGRQGRL
ncbi:metal ion binding [Homalodisca vitripennis]|nr:metal ion binding [Homalodisca vitripennis]